MPKPPTRNRHIKTPPKKSPPRSPPEPPQKHIPKPIAPEPHQSRGQTHRKAAFVPFSIICNFPCKVQKSCNKTFIKFFFGCCHKAAPFLLYMCNEGTPPRDKSQGHRAEARRHAQPPGIPTSRTKTATATHRRRAWENIADMVSEAGEQRPPCQDPCRESLATHAC